MRHQLTKHLRLLRIGCSDHCSHIAVRAVHRLLAPLTDLFSDHLVHMTAVLGLNVLKLSARGIGGLYQNKDALVLLIADIHKRFDSICSKIRIYGCKILIKRTDSVSADLNSSKVSSRICLRGRSDVSALHVTDHNQPLFLTVANRLPVCDHPRNSELLIHRNLRLHRRNQVCNRIHNLLVEAPDRLCRSAKILVIGRILHMAGSIL